SEEPIVVNGERVEYLYEQKKVIGVDNVVITYKDVTLMCDKIVVDMVTKEAIAEGHVILLEGGYKFLGEKAHYNFDTQKGTIIEAEARGDPWYGKGDTAAKVEEKQYSIDRGYLTTCNLPYPHYRVQARKIKIYVNDRVEAFHVIVFLGRYPIFYFPYYVHPLKDKRPRVTIVAGRNSRWGYFVLSAWRYYLHEWSRGYIHMDWREKKGLGHGIDYKYNFGYFGKGLSRFYYTNEKHIITTEEVVEGQSVGRDRWRVQVRHKWNLDGNTLAVGEFNKNSDKLFIKDYFFNDEYEKESQQRTFVSVIRNKPGYNLSLFFRVRTHNFFTVLEKLPELKLELKSHRIRDTDFYYKSTTSFVMLQKKYAQTAYSRQPKMKANRFDTNHEFSYLTKLFDFLTFNPYLGIRETWYSEDASCSESKLRNVNAYGMRFSTKFYRVFNVKSDALGLGINGLKHVVTPSIHYRYVPEPNVKTAELKQFDSLDAAGLHNRASLSVVNRLLTKRGQERIEATLARFTTSTQVLIKTAKNKSLSDVNFDLELTPYDWLIMDVRWIYDPKENSIDRVNTIIAAEVEDSWRVGFSYRFEDDHKKGSSDQIVTDTFYQLGPKWKIRSYHRFKKGADESGFVLEEQNYAIERDLHCWFAEFNYQMKKTHGLEVDEEHRVWLVMRLKAFPELPFKMFSKRYESPRAGMDLNRSK
ncbi:MAG: LPS-assembly protein LptD, partial [Candidatus Omnitrophica bacterium]|nr:LPS-assembly protein LptD [Candidatus Omnitrophota bacterium]